MFAEDTAFREYLRRADIEVPPKRTKQVSLFYNSMWYTTYLLQVVNCNLKADDLRRAVRAKGTDVAGQSSVTCGRHSIFEGQGTVDFYVGEK